MKFSYFYIDELDAESTLKYDIFISAFDGCERTLSTYNRVYSPNKKWIIFPQYVYNGDIDVPDGLYSDKIDEGEFILDVIESLDIKKSSKVCIDCTGFLVPHLLFLIRFLQRKGIYKFDILYSEPVSYVKGEDTVFTMNNNAPRPIGGYSTSARNINGDDALIIFAGFNNQLITNVARDKSKARYKTLFTGFPSLQADMYQQNLVQVYKSKETIGVTNVEYKMAPAYDPFTAADKLQNVIVSFMNTCSNVGYIHIAPLSTKPMAIASSLVYLYNENLPIDIIYPPSDIYFYGHAIGIKRTWRYVIELPKIL